MKIFSTRENSSLHSEYLAIRPRAIHVKFIAKSAPHLRKICHALKGGEAFSWNYVHKINNNRMAKLSGRTPNLKMKYRRNYVES